MFVQDCMTPDPTTIEPNASLADALPLMRALKIRHLPVVEGTKLVGIITHTDLMRATPSPATTLAVWEIPALLAKAQVRDVMTTDVITVPPDMPVEQAAYKLRKHKIGSLPVVHQGMLVGIVTESDVFDVLLYLLGGDVSGVRMTVDLPGGLQDLARLGQLLAALVLEKVTVTVSARIDDTVHRAYVRLATRSPLLLAEHLASGNFSVSGLRFDPGLKPDHSLS